jgi:hypothetical protein
MGARVYDPYTGTFTQPDPIPGAGANAYGYTDGDPVNETDLNGKGGHGGGPACLAHGRDTCPGRSDSGPSIGHVLSGAADSAASFVAHHYGTIAEVAGGGVCLFSAGIGCGIAAVAGFATASYQNLSSRHPSVGAEMLDAVGAIPGAQALTLEARGVATAAQLAPLARLGVATGWGADALDAAIESRGR